MTGVQTCALPIYVIHSGFFQPESLIRLIGVRRAVSILLESMVSVLQVDAYILSCSRANYP